MLYRRCWLVGWILCHLVRVADRSFGGAVSFSRFSCVGLARFVGSGVAVLCCHGIFLACVCFFSVSLLLIICALVLVNFCLTA